MKKSCDYVLAKYFYTHLLFRKWFFSKKQIYRSLDMCMKQKYFKTNLARTPRAKPKIQAKFFGFVVFCCSNKINLQKLSLWYSYNIHKILGTRAPTLQILGLKIKNITKMTKIRCFFEIFHPKIWRVGARARPIFYECYRNIIKTISVNLFCCYNKTQQIISKLFRHNTPKNFSPPSTSIFRDIVPT